MKKRNITYKGTEFPIIELPIDLIETEARLCGVNYSVIIADIELYYAIEDGVINNEVEAKNIDSLIYYYCDSGFVASNPTIDDIVKYFIDSDN